MQGSGDLDYLNQLDSMDDIEIIPGNLASYDSLLQDSTIDLDFVGTRLHAGVRAIQNKRRSIILGIDNRAEEKKKDLNLNVLSRSKISELENMINSDFETKINLNQHNIDSWRNQFK